MTETRTNEAIGCADLEEPFGQYSAAVERAWSMSVFADVSADAKNEILSTARVIALGAGEAVPLLFPEQQTADISGLAGMVIEGALRLYVTSDSRQVTLQYVGTGDAFGVPITYGSDLNPGSETLTNSVVLLHSPTTLMGLAKTDLTVASALIAGLRRAQSVRLGLLAENVMQPLRRRIARHLLDLAVRQDDRVVVSATVRDIAHATGTVREVATRTLKSMREQGLIARENGVLVILDMRRMHLVAQGAEI